MTDAEATVRGVLLEAIANTSIETGLFASPRVEILIDALVDAVKAPETRWAFQEL